jgi:Asp-tRNA(Asn)/Glu-tRNA(Gln) amidotransferase A subunit family amidase
MIAIPESCDLLSLASSLRSGNFPCLDYLNRLEALFDATEPDLHAFLPEQNRFARLRQEASELFERYVDPEHRPPLFAIPFAVDDTYHVSGFVTRAGSHLDPELLSGPEAPCVTRLRRAGGLILGKTATGEFGYSASAPTHNPHDPTQPLAMASAGAAAAVASGLTPLALGTQTLGAANLAASRCGVIAFKPSYQRLTTEGVIPLAPSLDHCGLLAGNLASLQWIFGLLTPVQRVAPVARPLNIGVCEDIVPEAIAPTIREHLQTTCETLRAEGCSVQSIPAPPSADHLTSLWLDLVAAEAADIHGAWYAAHPERYRKEFAELIIRGEQVPAVTAARARASRLMLRNRLENTMQQYQLDLWINPSVATTRSSNVLMDSALQLPWVVSGLPSLVLPAGFVDDGLPMGIQLTGRWYGDEHLLQCGELVAEMIEKHDFTRSGWF